MVDLEWYRTFKAIYQTGTLTGAAQELYISQPNVSQHLSALEAHVGKKLFERKPRRMVPTDYGKLFYTQIVGALEKLEDVEAGFRYTAKSDVPLTSVGAPKEFFHTLVAPRIAKTPANLIFEFGLTRDLVRKLVQGQLCFVIATHRADEKDIIYEPVREEAFLLVANAALDTTAWNRHIAAGETEEAEKWLCQQDWYAYSSDLPIIRRFWLTNFQKRPAIKPRFIIPDVNAILRSISLGGGITVASDYLVKDHIRQKELKELWKGTQPTTNTIYLAYNKNHVTTGQVEMMQKLLRTK